MDKFLKSNKKLWNALTGPHVNSPFYDVAGFMAGKERLHRIELDEVGDVKGKSLLHLQCHFGQDTLAWARLGAKVTGVDFSETAIDYARQLSRDIDINADFICSDIYVLPEVLNRQYDIVFTSYGVLCWLPDLKKWAEIIALFLKPCGFFYIIEEHPFVHVFYSEADATELRVTGRYFAQNTPARYEGGGDYASDFTHELTSFEWRHTMGDIINSLISAGLRIEYLHEFPGCSFKWFPFLKHKPDGMWYMDDDKIPLTFSLKATKS